MVVLTLAATDGEPEAETKVERLPVPDTQALREAKVSVAEADALPEEDNLAVFVADAVVVALREGEHDGMETVRDPVNDAELPVHMDGGVTEIPADDEAETLLDVPEGDDAEETEVKRVGVTAEDAEADPTEADEADIVMHPVADPESAPLFVIETV